jgi:hypothetical protein
MWTNLGTLFDKKGKKRDFISNFILIIYLRLTSQCEKCGQNLYPGLQETSSSSCKCKKQQSKGWFSL